MVNRVVLKEGITAGGELGARVYVIRFEYTGKSPVPLIPRGPGAEPGVSAGGDVLGPGFPIQCAARYAGDKGGAEYGIARVNSFVGAVIGVAADQPAGDNPVIAPEVAVSSPLEHGLQDQTLRGGFDPVE